MKDRQHNGKKKKNNDLQRTDNTMGNRKRTNNDLQNTTQKTKDQATRTPLKHIFVTSVRPFEANGFWVIY